MNNPNTVNTDERIFQVTNFEHDTFLCNLRDINYNDVQYIKTLKHYWNNTFVGFGMLELKEMIAASYPRIEKFYPISGRFDFFKYVIRKDIDELAEDYQGKVMYFDEFNYEQAVNTLNSIKKTSKKVKH